jgi:hypothetical protein
MATASLTGWETWASQMDADSSSSEQSSWPFMGDRASSSDRYSSLSMTGVWGWAMAGLKSTISDLMCTKSKLVESLGDGWWASSMAFSKVQDWKRETSEESNWAAILTSRAGQNNSSLQADAAACGTAIGRGRQSDGNEVLVAAGRSCTEVVIAGRGAGLELRSEKSARAGKRREDILRRNVLLGFGACEVLSKVSYTRGRRVGADTQDRPRRDGGSGAGNKRANINRTNKAGLRRGVRRESWKKQSKEAKEVKKQRAAFLSR